MIEHPNSCGQGMDPTYLTHPLTETIGRYNYIYSHSTPVRGIADTYILHTFKRGEHNVSIQDAGKAGPTAWWETSTSCANGRRWAGLGRAELDAHLKSKARRYTELRVKRSPRGNGDR